MRHLYLDEIVGNNSKQDKSAVVSLYDAALARIKREIPTAKYIYVLSDNARCYQNNLVPAMLPFITSTHGLHLVMLLHSETQDGKSLVDAHFAAAMMHVCRYVDQGNSVKTPLQLVSAINSNGGVANTVSDLVFMNRDSPMLMQWESSRGICRLPRLNEMQYTAVEGEPLRFTAKLYTMSGMQPSAYTLEQFSSTYQKEGSLAHSGTGNAANTISADDNEGAEEYTNDHDEGLPLFGSDEPTDVVISTSRFNNSWYIGSETGCSICTDAHTNYLTRRAALRRMRRSRVARTTPTEIQLATEDQKQQAEDAAALLSQASTRRNNNEGEQDKDINMPTCQKCNAKFRHVHNWAPHERSCKGTKPTKILDRAKLLLHSMIEEESSPLYSSVTGNPALRELVISTDLAHRFKRQGGRARRSAYGQGLGLNTAHLFKEDILEFVQRGVVDKAKKMSPAAMKEELRRRYPNRYDLPNEQFITRLVSAELDRIRKGRDRAGDHSSRARIQQQYTTVLQTLVRDDTNMKLMPRHAHKAVMENMGLSEESLPDNFPTKKQLASLCSRLRRMSKEGLL